MVARQDDRPLAVRGFKSRTRAIDSHSRRSAAIAHRCRWPYLHHPLGRTPGLRGEKYWIDEISIENVCRANGQKREEKGTRKRTCLLVGDIDYGSQSRILPTLLESAREVESIEKIYRESFPDATVETYGEQTRQNLGPCLSPEA